MGLIASGNLATSMMGSGIIINHAQETVPIYSGGMNTAISAEAISGIRAVTINTSGQIIIAMASVSGRMPAIGVAEENCLSGIQVNIHTVGFLQASSGLADYSGFLGSTLFVGRSGNVTQMSGSWGSGGWLAGDVGQPLGQALNSGAAIFNVHPTGWSGGPFGITAGGNK